MYLDKYNCSIENCILHNLGFAKNKYIAKLQDFSYNLCYDLINFESCKKLHLDDTNALLLDLFFVLLI